MITLRYAGLDPAPAFFFAAVRTGRPRLKAGVTEVAMNADELANRVAREMLAGEGTGPAWGITIEEVREDYARISMIVRADMLNSHGIAHGGMVFALADTAFAYV